MMRKPLVVGNWKMNTTLSDAIVLANSIKEASYDLEETEIVLCPPYTWIAPLRELFEHAPKNLKLGAQNMWFADHGAITGEVSAVMLKDIADYVIIGHSERRTQFLESNDLINDKIQAAINHGLTPILCVNESRKLQSLERSLSEAVIMLEKGLEGLSSKEAQKVVIGYEPVWAISTTKNSLGAATGEYAARAIFELRKVLSRKYNVETAQEIRIIYGGSVDADNIKEYVDHLEIDGVLVGGASLKAKDFIKICQITAGREE